MKWTFFLSIIFWRFTQIACIPSSFFFFLNCWVMLHAIYTSVCLNMQQLKTSVLFPIYVIMNKAAKNIYVEVFMGQKFYFDFEINSIKLVYQLGENWASYYFSIPVHEHSMFLLLFISSSISFISILYFSAQVL